jgi:hypothetical protein
MKRSPIALAIFTLLFVGWMIWLGTQAILHRKPVVVSRAQLLSAECVVVAEVTAQSDGKPSPTVHVKTILGQNANCPAAGQAIQIANLAETQGFGVAGTYALPLVKRGSVYAVADMPLDPGFSTFPPLPPSIYPWTAEVENQFAGIKPVQ